MEEYKGRAIICIRIGGGGRNPTLSRKNWPDGWRGSRFFPIVRFLDFLVDLGREESTDYFLSPLSLSLIRTTRSLSLSCSFARLLFLFLFLSFVRSLALSLSLVRSLALSFSCSHDSFALFVSHLLARFFFLCPAQFARSLALSLSRTICLLACSLSFISHDSLALSFSRSLCLSFSRSLARSLFLSLSFARLVRSLFLSRPRDSIVLLDVPLLSKKEIFGIAGSLIRTEKFWAPESPHFVSLIDDQSPRAN